MPYVPGRGPIIRPPWPPLPGRPGDPERIAELRRRYRVELILRRQARLGRLRWYLSLSAFSEADKPPRGAAQGEPMIDGCGRGSEE